MRIHPHFVKQIWRRPYKNTNLFFTLDHHIEKKNNRLLMGDIDIK